jgi:4-deoxy-L-threo-5-hexosulose-uronate ketol-isomerase
MMFKRNYYATHADMLECVSNEELREHYLVQDLFREGQVVLNHTHADRLVIGGVFAGSANERLPDQVEPASAAGHPFPERRELAIVNFGKTRGTVSVAFLASSASKYVNDPIHAVYGGWLAR